MGTQMTRPDLIVDTVKDKEIISMPYFSADQLYELKLEKTIVIQRYWRKHLAVQLTKKLRREIEESKTNKILDEQTKLVDEEVSE